MRDDFTFPATLEADPESGETVASFPDVPGAHTSAPTPDGDLTTLRAEAADCLEEAVARMLADREPLPTPSAPGPGDLLVPLPLRMAAKLALHRTCREQGIGVSELARRLDCQLREAQRLLDPKHQTKVDRLAEAVHAIGGPTLALGVHDTADAA